MDHDHAKCQQFELYAAEGGVQTGRTFAAEAELQAWVDALRETAWWERFYTKVRRVDVGFIPRGSGSVGAWHPERNAGAIEMLPVHRNELVVCHELSHVLADARYGSQAHCPWFARVYLEVVYFVMGVEVWQELLASFDAAGVEHNPEPPPFDWGRRREVGATS